MGRRTEETASSLDVDLFSVDCTMGSVDRFGLVVLLFSLLDCLNGDYHIVTCFLILQPKLSLDLVHFLGGFFLWLHLVK